MNRTLLPATTCPHLTLDSRDPARLTCRQCGTLWDLIRAADRDGPDLFGGAA